jgi:hypothetical protein
MNSRIDMESEMITAVTMFCLFSNLEVLCGLYDFMVGYEYDTPFILCIVTGKTESLTEV